MPFQLLDLVLAGIMLISGLLALTRGFTREVLSLVSWGLAAAAGLFASYNDGLVELAYGYLESDVLARVAVGGGVFLVVLIILSIISVRVADWVLDSAAGTFDRTLGLAYGLGRGLLLVVVAYLFYVWLVPVEKREDWVRNARSLPMIESTGEFVTEFLPPDIRDTLHTRIAAGNLPPVQRTDSEREAEEGYGLRDSTVLDQLIESTQSGRSGTQQEAPQDNAPLFGGETQGQN